MVDTIKFGTPVNGCKTVKQWCAEVAKVTPRYVQYILKGKRDRIEEVAKRTSGSLVTAHLQNVEFDEDRVYCVIEIDQSHEVKYQGKRLSENDSSSFEDNGNCTRQQFEELKKEDKVVWTRRINEVGGSVHVTFQSEDVHAALTKEQLLDGLRKKLTATLKSMRLWDDKLTAEFDELVQERTEWEAERKQSRSESAKRAAATRKARAVKNSTPAISSDGGRNGAKVQHPAAAGLEETLNSLPPTPVDGCDVEIR